MNHYDCIIIGAGPAGLIAAVESHLPSKKILILEKMHKPAIKLRLSGKGRCNITNEAPLEEFLAHFGKNQKFLKYAFSEFFNADLLDYFRKEGVRFKLERGGRWFPESDRAMEIVDALLRKVEHLNIPIWDKAQVTNIEKSAEGKFIVRIIRSKENGKTVQLSADKVLIATGGKSYPKTGSTGDGYALAAQLGHTVTKPQPSLVPIETKGDLAPRLEGLSLRNVSVSVWCDGKKAEEQFGEMVFTDSGLSGPVILSLSRTVVTLLNEQKKVQVSIDLKPVLEHKKVDQRILREIDAHGKQSFKSLLKQLLPKKLIPVFLEMLNIPEDKQLSQVSSDERKRLRVLLKEFRFEATGYGSYARAIVTVGGVRIKEINPKTMESRLVKNLYFAGEVIDVDADTGGYNLQAAFSTGWVAGRAIKQSF